MLANDHDLLNILKSQLNFLTGGGYRRSTQTPWRSPLIFEDSPTCKSYYCEQNAHPCSECPLLRFVPPEDQDRTIACRYIPLSAKGDTLDSLYHFAYEAEIQEAVGSWLESKIDQLERKFELESATNARTCSLTA